ncbi:unnamed protein product [Owenia fusiformis]|uniref:Arf-GAP domain-containing protein n=1 Tax=Owenia fusiformis TaxID=6347 RepID=A0A8S4NNH3_OWEFU|nr:unnamed protein product [Owenia fusiformis]
MSKNKMAANKRKQDEKHLKMLRAMVSLPHNKQCFDCHQRGPTYVNMTTGSYVCTSCSGILRGITPPHRVKSITMTSFSPDDIEYLKCHGNDYCRKVWLGLYDSRSGAEPDSRDENKVKEFMSQKYEKKRWYVAPNESMKEEAKHMNQAAIDNKADTKSIRTIAPNAPKLVVNQYQKPPSEPAVQKPVPTSVSNAAPAAVAPQAAPPASGLQDIFGELGGDPFSSASSTQQAQQPPAGGGFANFNNFGAPQVAAPVPQSSAVAPTSQAFPPGGGLLQPLGQASPAQPNVPASSSQNFPAFSTPSAAPSTTQTQSGGNKYSNLADLFSGDVSEGGSLFSGGATSETSVFGGSLSTEPVAPPAGGINWGSGAGGPDTNTGGGGSLQWNSPATSSAGSSGISWNGSSNVSSSSSYSNQASVGQMNANPFGGTNTSTTGGNPFGGGQPNMAGGFGAQPGFGQSQAGFGVPAASQPAAQSTPNAGFPYSQSGGFSSQQQQPGAVGQFSGMNTQAGGGGFGHFGQPAPTQTATMQNGGGQGHFGGQPQPQGQWGQPQGQVQQPAGGFGQFGAKGGQGFAAPQQQQPQQQQFGSWGQPAAQQPVGNPFMAGGVPPQMQQQQQQQQPRANSTNPFL